MNYQDIEKIQDYFGKNLLKENPNIIPFPRLLEELKNYTPPPEPTDPHARLERLREKIHRKIDRWRETQMYSDYIKEQLDLFHSTGMMVYDSNPRYFIGIDPIV